MIKYINKYKNKNHLLKPKNKIISSILTIGTIGIISITTGYLTEKELESCKKNILKKIKNIENKKNLIIKRNPFLNQTFKPLATRMGKGKGLITKWLLPIKKGMVLFELKCTKQTETQIKGALKLALHSLSIKTKIIKNIY